MGHLYHLFKRPRRTIAKGASTLDGQPDSPHDTISPRLRCCLFFAYREVSDFLWGNFLYTGKVVE